MNIDGSIPIWGLITMFVTPTGLLVWRFISLYFKVIELEKQFAAKFERLEKDVNEVEDNYWLVKSEIDKEVKTIHTSIAAIDKNLQQLNDYIKLLIEGKINIEQKKP